MKWTNANLGREVAGAERRGSRALAAERPCSGRAVRRRRMGGEDPEVVGPLEGGRVADRALAQPAADRGHRLVAVPVEPVPEMRLDVRQVVGALAQQRRG